MIETFTEVSTDIAEGLFRTPSDPRILMVDGYDCRLAVRGKQLQVIDGIGTGRRTRIVSRTDGIRRIVILSGSGLVTLESIRWCESEGIAIIQCDHDGSPIMTAAPSYDSPHIRQMQAIASAGYLPHLRINLVKSLLTAKLDGQAEIADTILNNPSVSESIMESCRYLSKASDIPSMLSFEGHAAKAYWKAWQSQSIAWNSTRKLPAHWLTSFPGRSSGTRKTITPINRNRSFGEPIAGNRGATDPINAMLNYAYSIAESEAIFACLAHGLDPALGFQHGIQANRQSMALDLLEVARPYCDRIVLNILSSPVNREWFYEIRHGIVRLSAPLTHILSEQCIGIAKTIQNHAATMMAALNAANPA